ncbi:AAA family ATPase [Kitasatospora sp. NPDC002965]|uniref:AAA family ATPase n=1 Tax=Kitasatospora sp. NPDC002965 TaxID=3154775 RepID=UPI0033A20B74
MHQLKYRLLRIAAENYRSLAQVNLPLGQLTALVGENAVGKSNVMDIIKFLAEVCHSSLEQALADHQGYESVAFRGKEHPPGKMRICLEGIWTQGASEADPDRYELVVRHRRHPSKGSVLWRTESITRHAGDGAVAVLTVDSRTVTATGPGWNSLPPSPSPLGAMQSVLEPDGHLLLGPLERDFVAPLRELLSDARVFEIDVRLAREPWAVTDEVPRLAADARNLADFLYGLKRHQPTAWKDLVADMKTVVKSVVDVDVIGADRPDRVHVVLTERGLHGVTALRDASFGTVRLLALLGLAHDPHSRSLSAIEELDHGVHPDAMGLIMERLREVQYRTQFLVTTHSESIISKLDTTEYIHCDRDSKGRSLIGAQTGRRRGTLKPTSVS